MKVLLLGGNGMLGHALADAFADLHPFRYDFADLDLTDEAAVRQRLAALHPDVIINAAAYTNVDACEEAPEYQRALAINAAAVGALGSVAKTLGALLVHYSTDYVFDGSRQRGYREDDRPNPVNAYGRSKAEGEKLLIASGTKYLLLRTSWLFGPYGKNFVDTILTKSREVPELSVVNDQFGSPTYTRDLAQRTRELVTGGAEGIHHATNEGTTTWFAFADAALRRSGSGVPVRPITSAQAKRKARRPRYSTLMNTKDPPLRSWQEALAAYLGER